MSVALRPLKSGDGDQVLAWRNTREVAAFMYTDHTISPIEHGRWLKAALAGGDCCYWIIEVDGAGVGLANLARIDPVARRCELGHYLANPRLRGTGVGACVEYIILQNVFQTRRLNKLWCEVLIENEAAWRLHEGFGFQREALLRDHIYKGGAFHDVVGFGLLARDWTLARPACEARLSAKGYDVSALGVQSA